MYFNIKNYLKSNYNYIAKYIKSGDNDISRI
jgi:hypothetical protein